MTAVAQPFVSVCLLTYKRAAVLRRSIDSLLLQTHTNFELIINDDHSPDETEAVCRAFEQRDPRIRYFRNPRNLGQAANQNAALARARADYVAFVHDGDIYRPELIEKWVRALTTYPTAAIAFCAMDAVDLQGRFMYPYRYAYEPRVAGRRLLDEMLRIPHSPIFGIVMVRRSCVEKLGGFDTRFPVLSDVDMWMQLLARHDAAYIAEPLFEQMVREPGHPNDPANWRIRAEYTLIYRLNFLRRHPTPSREAEQLRRHINAMLRRQRFRALAWCLRHLRFKSFLAGVRYCWRQPEAVRWPPGNSTRSQVHPNSHDGVPTAESGGLR